MMGRFDDELVDILPRTGRQILESGEFINEADISQLQSVIDPAVLAQRGQLFQFQDFREDVAASNEYTYRLLSPSDKKLIILSREITIGEGPVLFYSVSGGTGFTGGTPLSAFNVNVGGAASETSIIGGVTVTGTPTDSLADYIPGSGNKSGFIGINSNAPLILPPNFELFVKLQNQSGGVNPMIKLGYVFAELELPPVS